ncbi:hypothetical protein CRH09_15335 [Nocardia terpenica]|uniref:Uncharacterized protein n=2 Tax=Nocardia terpenica TaxID=455432 RepID=A0A291RJ64_9NOCA|nr:hypothetical protein CRH09_15335 [Nocardia terpenica]
MLDDVRSEINENPGAVVAIVLRDGATIGMTIRELDPDLFDSGCRLAYLSRKSIEAVLQDQENNAGRTFPALEPFRDRGKADPDDVPGATFRLEKHLIRSGLPVTTPGAHIILLDSGHRGTIQEGLSAAFPKPSFSGHYLFHVQSPDDPHKGTKTGHILHLSPERAHPADPEDPARIYTDKDPVAVFEHLLHGTMSTTHGHDDRGNPLRQLEYPSTDQISPLVLAPQYSDPQVRIAIMDIAQRTVANCARTIAAFDRAGIDYRPQLTEQARTCTQRVQSWAYGDSTGDPAFNALADSFVRRTDKNLVHRLRAITNDLGIVATTATWLGYHNLSPTHKERYVDLLERTTDSPGPATPEGQSHG